MVLLMSLFDEQMSVFINQIVQQFGKNDFKLHCDYYRLLTEIKLTYY